jgi:ribosome-binding ATPase YchF (GTP1/OBG family)
MNKKLQAKIIKRIDELVLNLNDLEKEGIRLESGSWFEGKYSNYSTGFSTARTSTLNLLDLIDKKEFTERINNLVAASSDIYELRGILLSFKDAISSGLLTSINTIIEANISGDYLAQAEQLLLEGKTRNYDHVPAAVLTGAILEDALRRLCQRQAPPIEVIKRNGQYKMLNALIDDLKKTGLYNELKAKQLRAWADIRNAAAHGLFDDFNRKDTEEMLKGVQNFLADYM